MLPKTLLSLFCSLLLLACNAQNKEGTLIAAVQTPNKGALPKYTLSDFYAHNPVLQVQVEEVFNKLNDQQRVGQMIVAAAGRLGKPDAVILELLRNQQLGGVILLNGSKESFKKYKSLFDSLNHAKGGLPLIYSADAEPSLINRKIEGSRPMPKTSQLTDVSSSARVAKEISQELKEIGILYNYAPVADLSLQNKAIGSRSYGSDPQQVQELANAFIRSSQAEGVIATAKHFPGHGLVKGDSHHKLVFIDGELKEAPLYRELIGQGVLSIMVGHIAVENNPKYNTKGLPATCSRPIVSGLLKEEMGFKGIITTDAMNMGAVASIPDAGLLAAKAGCDMILMPVNEKEVISGILKEMEKDPAFKEQVYDSVKKIIRMKFCAGLI